MTFKQLIVGTVIGASALGNVLQKLPAHQPAQAVKPAIKHAAAHTKHKVRVASRHTHRKHVSDSRLSLNKVFE